VGCFLPASAGVVPDLAHWSADLQFLGTANPPNYLHAVAVFDTGGLQLVDDPQPRSFRCVHQPLTPE